MPYVLNRGGRRACTSSFTGRFEPTSGRVLLRPAGASQRSKRAFAGKHFGSERRHRRGAFDQLVAEGMCAPCPPAASMCRKSAQIWQVFEGFDA